MFTIMFSVIIITFYFRLTVTVPVLVKRMVERRVFFTCYLRISLLRFLKRSKVLHWISI